jgi:hypothetical protein
LGFFSGLSGIAGAASGLFGGSKTSQAVPASGYYSMPPEYQKNYKAYNTQLGDLFSNPATAQNMFTPMALGQGEQNALGNLAQGFTATPESINQDLSMLMNPFDQYVTNDINREAQGQNSLVNQFGSQTGQMGSNRNFLATSDVEQNRLNNIGKFKQSQYNTAIDQILNNLTNSRRADAQGALAGGTYQRDLDLQTKQAPFTSLSAYGGLLGAIPTQFGTQSQASTVEGGSKAGDILGKIGTAAQIAGSLAGFFSDRELKQDIEFVGLENGYNIYEFSYKDDPSKKYIGVIAQEVESLTPGAVKEIGGYKAVDYDKIGVRFREVD